MAGYMEHTYRENRLLSVAACLLCLTLFSFWMLSGLLAKYVSAGTGQDEARVARFDITCENGTWTNSIALQIIPGDNITDTELEICNKSEVAVAYTISVKNETGNIQPLVFSITDTGATDTGDGNRWESSTPIEAGATVEGTLSVRWNATSGERAESYYQNYMGMVDYITITVTATQID